MKTLIAALLIAFVSPAFAANDDDNAPESPAYEKCLDKLSQHGKKDVAAFFHKCDQIVYGVK